MSLDGVPCPEATLTVPLGGAWVLDVRTASDAKDGASVTCSFGDLEFVGTAFRSGNFSGTGMLRVVGGKGGWRKTIPARFYGNSFGLKVAEIVADAARECGEEMASAAPGTTGRRYVRMEDPAARTLQILCPSWWTGYDGRTNPSARPGGRIVVPLNVMAEGTSLSKGVVSCSPATLATVLPGATFTAPTVPVEQAVTMVVHRATPDRVRTELWTR